MTAVPPQKTVAIDAAAHVRASAPAVRTGLYTPEERKRRDATKWTLVQGLLAPVQFLVMAISVALVLRYLKTGQGLEAAHISIVVKTFVLYTIMVTGAIWEKVVFGQYLFHESFFWEDVVSFFVIGQHTAYLVGLYLKWDPRFLMWMALVAYAAYTVNAIQFILKLRAARLQEAAEKAARAAATEQMS
ncbi:2-vinyl bacteriochlorophyllide hydratase [Gemmatimonas phototrophica]|uniref:2-vinyl bacteriochlorophyllide hydratase n=1 Tax=Gemmatimonas phototrophica TaxID=1379270 RepID=UPI0009EE0B5B|nr:2-vinyl bacteriochlorophyllide hydratase [Gemmatimonas phototrophica]